MNLLQAISELFDHVRSMWRYRWWANGIAWMLFLAGWIYVSTIPDIYRASSRVFVDTNSLLRPLMQGLTASQDPLDEVQLVSKAVLTRPNLEDVARSTDLALRADTPQEFEALVTGLQSRVRVAGGGDNIFRIEFEDVSREKAREVVSAILDTFIESSLSNEGSDAEMTEQALAGELAVHEQRLRDAEERLAQFKQDNLGYMPGEYGDYYERLQTVLDNIERTRETVGQVEDRRDELRRQIDGEAPVFGIMSDPLLGGAMSCSQSGYIQDLEGQLSALRVEFTDKHPRLNTLRETIAALKEECEAEMQAAAASARAGCNTRGRAASGAARALPAGESLEVNPVYQNLKIQLSEAEVELVQLKSQLRTYEAQEADLRRDVDKITEVEAQLKQLNRDYAVVTNRHQELLRRWEDLQAKKRLDPVTDNVQFRVIEPPFALTNPVGPDRPLLLVATLAFAIGGGLAVAFGLSQINPVFFNVARLGQAAAQPILGSVSMIVAPQARRRRRLGTAVWCSAFAALIVFAVFAVMFAARVAEYFGTLAILG